MSHQQQQDKQDLEDLDASLAHLEATLNGPSTVFAHHASNNSNTNNNNAGRSAWASIGSALEGLRQRIFNNNNEDLQRRWEWAHRSHATRTPLDRLHTELERRRQNNNSEDQEIPKKRQRRQSSILLSSRSSSRRSSTSINNGGMIHEEEEQQQDTSSSPPEADVLLRQRFRQSVRLLSKIEEDDQETNTTKSSNSNNTKVVPSSSNEEVPSPQPQKQATTTKTVSDDTDDHDIDDMDSQNAVVVQVVLDPEVSLLLAEEDASQLEEEHKSVLFRSMTTSVSSLAPDGLLWDEASAMEEEGEENANNNNNYPWLPQIYSWGHQLSPGQSLYDDDDDDNTKMNEDNTNTMDLEPIGPSHRMGRTRVVAVATSGGHSAVVSATGVVYACGDNTSGQVDPTSTLATPSIPKPTVLEGLTTPVVQIACGYAHTAAVTATGAVVTWGDNAFGQLGHASANTNILAMNLGPRKHAASVACGHSFTLVLTSRMQVLVAGIVGKPPQEESEEKATTATATATTTTVPALMGLPVVQIAAGAHHAVVATCHGSVLAWGDNGCGQCGQEAPSHLATPVQLRHPQPQPQPQRARVVPSTPLPTPEHAMGRIACGDHHTLLISKRHGKLWGCGNNETGQLGLSPQEFPVVYSLTAIPHPGGGGVAPPRIVLAAAGSNHSLILDSEQNVYQFGNNDNADNKWTKLVLEDRSIVHVEAGGNHSIAVSSLPPERIPPALPAPGGAPKRGFSQLIEAQQHLGDHSGAVVSSPNRLLGSGRSSSQSSSTALVRSPSNNSSNQDAIAHSMEDLVVAISKPSAAASTILSEEAVRELANRSQELLQSPAVLNGLFLNPMDLDKLFNKVLKSASDQPSRQLLASSMEKGMFLGLESLRSARLLFPESVRVLLLYLQCPLFAPMEDRDALKITFDRRGDLLLLLCDTILGLNYEGYKSLRSWILALYSSREVFVHCLIRPLMHQLERGLDPEAGPVQRVVPQVVALLQWLHDMAFAEQILDEASSTALVHPILAQESDFWSAAVQQRDPRRAYKDLALWKACPPQERPRNFFLCAHPFLFSPATKRNLLAVENEMEMFHTATQDGVTYNYQDRTIEFNPFWVLELDREYLLTQTLQKVSEAKPNQLRKKLRVVFKGEDGVDAGGVTREFFQLLSEQLFDIQTGMWSSRFDEEDITWFNSDCFWNDEGYYLVGILVGLAVYNAVLLDVHFPQAVYRKLLGLPLGLEDMVDSRLRKSLEQLLDYEGDDVEDIFCLAFSLNWMDLGREKTIELKPGGDDIPVTSENKEEYVQLYVKWLLEESIHPQYDAFERGFMKVMEHSTLDFLSPEELELLVVGTPELDFDALERNTEYEGYDVGASVVQNLWKFLHAADRETQLSFLKFSTGSTKAPIGGLGELPFKIQRNGGDSMQLPTSHTCFNTLLLPDYGDNYEKLSERLGRAVLECEGFGLQ